jgi:hypothetical protein
MEATEREMTRDPLLRTEAGKRKARKRKRKGPMDPILWRYFHGIGEHLFMKEWGTTEDSHLEERYVPPLF